MYIEIDLTDPDQPECYLNDGDCAVLTVDEFTEALSQLITYAPEGMKLFAWVQRAPEALPSLYTECCAGSPQLEQITSLAMRLAGEMMTGGEPLPDGDEVQP